MKYDKKLHNRECTDGRVDIRIDFFCFRLDYIAFANLDGTNKKYIIEEGLAHIFAITMFEDYIYWTDWENSNVERAHKYTGSNRTAIGSTIHRPMDIQIYHKFRQTSFKKDQVCNS